MPLPDFLALREQIYAHAAADLVNDDHRAMEAITRVKELDWIVRRCHALEATAVALDDSPDESSRTQADDALLELRILMEAFYHCAWRLIVLLDHRDEPLVGVKGLRRMAPGVRDVRNQLIEHPEGEASRVFAQSFSYGDLDGPKIKSVRQGKTVFADDGSPLSSLEHADPSRHDWFDRGLYANARELVDALGSMLRKPA